LSVSDLGLLPVSSRSSSNRLIKSGAKTRKISWR
jgi:hypothetical protein